MSDRALRPGMWGSRYEILKGLGSGGMADVYLGRDVLLDRRVVIKRLKPSLVGEGTYAAMFLDEARTVARIDHPNIVDIYDFGVHEETPFMVLEWLEGWDLRSVLQAAARRGCHVPLPVVLHMMAEACQGLHAAHTACAPDGTPLELVHRDVSPHNLFATTAGVLAILDFGVSKSVLHVTHTLVGRVKGKSPYMSPEQITGRPLDRRSDVFSLGIVLHELITGRSLFGGLDLRDVYNALTRDPILPPERPVEPVPGRLVDIVVRALERDRDLRYGSAERLGADLAALLDELDPGLTPADVAASLAALFAGGTAGEPTLAGAVPTTVAFGRIDDESPTLDTLVPQEAWSQTVLARLPTVPIERAATQPATSPHTVIVAEPPSRPLGARAPLLAAGFVVVILGWWLLTPGVAPPRVDEAPPPQIAGSVRPPASAPAADEPLARPSEAPAPSTASRAERRPEPRPESSAVEPRPSDTGRRARRSVPEPRRPAPPPESGRLTLQSIPWAEVFLGERRLGVTPLINTSVPAGELTLRLVNPELGVSKLATIHVPAGGAIRHLVRLEAE